MSKSIYRTLSINGYESVTSTARYTLFRRSEHKCWVYYTGEVILSFRGVGSAAMTLAEAARVINYGW